MRNEFRALAAVLMIAASTGYVAAQQTKQNPLAPSQNNQNQLDPNENKSNAPRPEGRPGGSRLAHGPAPGHGYSRRQQADHALHHFGGELRQRPSPVA